MANDKDFIVKNTVEVGGPTNVTLGTVTSDNIDLSTGNYFKDTLAANTTYTISNAGDVQSFQLEVTGGSVADFASGTQLNSLDVSSQENEAQALFFKSDGTKMYYAGINNDTVYQYSLSTAWDISTATYDSVSVSLSGYTGSVKAIFFKSDGTRLYVNGGGNVTYQWNLSTAWDLSTASYSTQSSSVMLPGSGTVYGLFIKPDGTKAYTIEQSTDTIYQFSMSSAWNISTISYDSVTLSVQTEAGEPRGIWFNSTGTKLYVYDNGFGRVHTYTLGTAWDLSTASYDSSYLTAVAEITQIYVRENDLGFYGVKRGAGAILQYSTTTDATLTWPSSIEWAGGVAPAAPAVGETDVFTITTDDGGTTYTGVKTADNLS